MTPANRPTLDLVRLSGAGFSVGAEADALNDALMGHLGAVTRNVVARLAIARSLSVREPPAALDEKGGKLIKGENLFGEDLRAWVVLLLEHEPSASVRDVPALQDVVRRHWARGLRLLDEEWKSSGGDFNKFLLALASHAGFRTGGAAVADHADGVAPGIREPRPVVLTIGDVGEDLTTRQKVEWTMNGPGRSPHIAVMGTLGTGKTRTAMTMVRAMRAQSGCPVLLFDMGKGDLAADHALVEALGATVIEPTRTPVPLDVLHVDPSDQSGVVTAAMRFRESFIRVPPSRLGGAQQDLLRDAAQRALVGARPVRLRDVRDRLREVYAERKRKDDVATATFNDMMSWQLFEPQMKPAEFFSKSWIIDVHKAPETAQRLVVFLLLDALYAYLTQAADTSVDAQGHRAMRIVLVVDEARKVLAYEQQSLIGLVRESRSKGGAVVLISQSPDDFDQVEEDFLENIGLGVVFRTNARPQQLTRMLGSSVDLASLKDGVCVTRLVDRGLVRVQAWQPQAG